MWYYSETRPFRALTLSGEHLKGWSAKVMHDKPDHTIVPQLGEIRVHCRFSLWTCFSVQKTVIIIIIWVAIFWCKKRATVVRKYHGFSKCCYYFTKQKWLGLLNGLSDVLCWELGTSKGLCSNTKGRLEWTMTYTALYRNCDCPQSTVWLSATYEQCFTRNSNSYWKYYYSNFQRVFETEKGARVRHLSRCNSAKPFSLRIQQSYSDHRSPVSILILMRIWQLHSRRTMIAFWPLNSCNCSNSITDSELTTLTMLLFKNVPQNKSIGYWPFLLRCCGYIHVQ